MKAQPTPSEIKIYIEGGGDGPSGKAALRQGFNALFAKQRDKARSMRWRWDIVLCGGRNAALDAFTTAFRQNKSAIVALLVDAEGSVSSHEPEGRIEHLTARDKWDLRGFTADRVHLMTQSMETWIIADPEKLQSHYGQGFVATALPKRQQLDAEDRHAISRALSTATSKTKKGSYHKIHHASELLAKIRPDKVSARCESFRVFTRWLDQQLG